MFDGGDATREARPDMTDSPPTSLRDRNRQTTRDVVLDAAERLLRAGAAAEFSMRALAAEAGVGFATPFNHFGSKTAIMQALSARLIARIAARFRDKAPDGDAVDRVLGMSRIAVKLLLEQPDVYKAVVGSLGVVSAAPSAVKAQSRALWSLALGDCSGLRAEIGPATGAILAEQLAFGFRGCLSFWIAGELADAELAAAVDAGAAIVLLGFVSERRRRLLKRIEARAAGADR